MIMISLDPWLQRASVCRYLGLFCHNKTRRNIQTIARINYSTWDSATVQKLKLVLPIKE